MANEFNYTAALGVAGASISAYQAFSNKQKKNKMIKEQKKIITENFQNNISALNRQFQLSKENTFREKLNNDLNLKKEVGNVSISASEQGFSGVSVNQAVKNIEFANEYKNSINQRNLENLAANLNNSSLSMYSEYKAQIKQLNSQKGTNFDVIMGAISGSQTGMQLGSSVYNMKNKKL